MVQEISYSVISPVIESWEALRRIPNFEQVAGIVLYQNLFTLAPESKVLFGFPHDMDPLSPDIVKSPRFVAHARYFIRMVDSALNMLGPDIELLTEVLTDLGAKHLRFGVDPAMFEQMGRALALTLEHQLGAGIMTDKVHRAWDEVYAAMSGDMIWAMKATQAAHIQKDSSTSPMRSNANAVTR